MNILLINSSDETVLNGAKGGNQLLTETLHDELTNRTDHDVDLELLPFDDRTPISLYKTYKRARTYDVSDYDAVISMKYPSYCVNHDNHICLFNHRKKQFYSEWDEFHAKTWAPLVFSKIRDKIHRIDHNALSQTRILAQSHTIANRLNHTGLHCDVLHPPPQLTDLESKSYDHVLLPSRLEDRNKRISLAIQAANNVDDMQLIITGDGPDRDRLERLADDTSVSFTGFVPEDKLRELYAHARAVLFLGKDEDYGLTAVEAMHASKPVITCVDSGGPLDLVENNKTGYVTTPDVENLTAILEHAQQTPSACKALGRKAQDHVNHITWPAYIERVTTHVEAHVAR
jgi:glycosyltransferase involved in cell wall biosynthesis